MSSACCSNPSSCCKPSEPPKPKEAKPCCAKPSECCVPKEKPRDTPKPAPPPPVQQSGGCCGPSTKASSSSSSGGCCPAPKLEQKREELENKSLGGGDEKTPGVTNDEAHEMVKAYYTARTQGGGTASLETCACLSGAVPKHLRALAAEIHPEITSKFYGCGSPIPPALQGRTVLDLGCGTGRDSFIVAKLVGAEGHVIGVDMTEAQLEVARSHVAYHMDKWGFSAPNIEFKQGVIENLADLTGGGIPDNSVDVVISNCVINLSMDKPKVLAEIFRVLKPGGELYFSDVFTTNHRIPPALTHDAVLLGECIAGAMFVGDFKKILADLGCATYRVAATVSYNLADSSSQDIPKKLGDISFASLTVRAFKAQLQAPPCEDFGQRVRYLGTVEEFADLFPLAEHQSFPRQQWVRVCNNTARMLQQSRYAQHFEVVGDESNRLGTFAGCVCSE